MSRAARQRARVEADLPPRKEEVVSLLVEPTDGQLASYLRRHIANIKAGVKASSMSCKIDGYWVVVTVEPSLSQRDWPRFAPHTDECREAAP